MATKELAEMVILQSIEDLWDWKHKDSCSSFFCNNNFSFWADIAGLTFTERKKLLLMIVNVMMAEDTKQGVSPFHRENGEMSLDLAPIDQFVAPE